MKRIGIVLLSLFFILGGCGERLPPTPNLEFTADVIISFGDSLTHRSVYNATLTSTSPQGRVVLRIKSDDALDGLQYQWDRELTMSYNGLSLKAKAEYLPEFSFAQCIYNVLCDLPQKGEFIGFEGESAVFSGRTESGEYRVKTDSKGNIEEISSEELNMNVTFAKEV